MKTLLIALFIVVGLQGSGQVVISDSLHIFDSIYISHMYYDTTDVVFLVCDTTSTVFEYIETPWGNKPILILDTLGYVFTPTKIINDNVFWVYGMVVFTHNPYTWSISVEYLDESGDAFPKGYIIWDSKEIKK